ncbi:MAG: Nif3-like dinuclear metal center hexameric protein [Oscillospiraceae bacterium]|jgi:dinuclear metal center YbgI/SA1388 family protein|nr:Nif3-like dinuclear metal center hexameric protein [Oscillospiraceae bacterium]
MTLAADLLAWLDSFAPLTTQLEFDNSGLLVGDAAQAVTRVLLTLDVTQATVSQAEQMGAELILAHHPVIFRARKQLLRGDPAWELARRGIACIGWHTPLDSAAGGVNDALALALGWETIPLPNAPECGVRLAQLEAKSAEALAAYIGGKLNAHVRFCDAGQPITRVALCGGAGGIFLPEVIRAGATAYLTGDADHHLFLDARQAGLSLLAAGHYETESPLLPALAARLGVAFPALQIQLSEELCPIQTI